MGKLVKVDAMGRVVLPMPVRRRFGLARGARLEIRVKDGVIELSPQNPVAGLREVKGLLVHQGVPQAAVEGLVEEARAQRDRANWGM